MPTRLLLAFTLAAAVIVGCAQPDAATTGPNEVTVLLTDAPVSEATALVVDFGRVELVASGDNGVVTVADSAGSIDVLALTNGLVETLGVADLPDGTYHQVRLIVAEATLAFGEEEHDVFVPSGAQTGLKIGIEPPLVVAGGVSREVLIDFDVHRAIVETPPGSGTYLLVPTALRAFSAAGGIDGTVVAAETDAAASALAGVQVDVLAAGETDVISTTYTEDDGSFAFIALLEGSYDLAFTLPGYDRVLVTDVPVVASQSHALDVVEMTATTDEE